MTRAQWLVVFLFSPVIIVLVGINLAVAAGLLAAVQLSWASQTHSSSGLHRGLALAADSTRLLDLSLNSPPGRLIDVGGSLDDVRAAAGVLGAAGESLQPLGELGNALTGWDGEPPLLEGQSIHLDRLQDLAGPVGTLNRALAETRSALADVPGTGPVGRRLGAAARSLDTQLAQLAPLVRAADAAMPDLAEALGSQGARYYLLAGLNDAELFGSGGAPLYAALIKADGGTLSIELSGQLESKLSPGNKPIPWEPIGGLPWYRDGTRYPFVNSNFHPDFGVAAQDMSRAWAGLGYPEVDGVITMDLNALANILERTGPVKSTGWYGVVTAQNVVQKVLVDSYREFGSQEVAKRHASNDALAAALASGLSDRLKLYQALLGILESIPPRHVQADFATQSLSEAADVLGATGTLSRGPGDMIGTFSQSSPNKLSVFQQRAIVQEVRLSDDGGAVVRRSVRTANAVPKSLPGNPMDTRSYEALRARLRLAHRIPIGVGDLTIATQAGAAFVPVPGTGPFPDDRGGQVLWQGHEIGPRDSVVDVISYRVPAGTFTGNRYEVWADPQAMTTPVSLVVRVFPAPGDLIDPPEGWSADGGALVWSGTLDRTIHLVLP